MPRVTTDDAPNWIRQRLAFTTNGALAATYRGSNYVVTSYTNALAVVLPDGAIFYNDALYSKTTSHHQAITRDGLQGPGIRVRYDNPAEFAAATGHHARLRTH